jgi:hypothetical protein
MERFLIISGRIISFIFVIVGVLLLVLLLSTTLLINATAVVPTFGQNLVNDHVIDDLPNAIWQTFTDALPEEVVIGETTISTEPLLAALGRSLQDILASGLPLGEWLQSRADQILTNLVTEVRGSASRITQGRVADLQDALSGSNAEPLVNLLLAALDQCTDAQVQQIQQLLDTAPAPGLSVGVSFLCNPPESLGVSARDLMKNALTLVLAELGNRAANSIEDRLQTLEIEWPTIDTPLGPATIEWPNIRLGTNQFSVSVPLPDNVIQAVENVVADIRAQFGARVAEATQQAQDAQATLAAAGSALATEVSTRTPPTATQTPDVTATLTPVPTISPDQLQAERDAVGPLEQRILDLTQGLGDSLAEFTGQVTTILLLLFGLPLIIHGYLQLYLMRKVRWWLLWIGLVMVISGAILFIIQNALNTSLNDPLDNPVAPTLSEPLAAVGASIRHALQDALQATLFGPFQGAAVFLVIVGLGLLVLAIYLFWRVRKARALPPDVPPAESDPEPPAAPALTAAPVAPVTPALDSSPPSTLDDEQPFPPSP